MNGKYYNSIKLFYLTNDKIRILVWKCKVLEKYVDKYLYRIIDSINGLEKVNL